MGFSEGFNAGVNAAINLETLKLNRERLRLEAIQSRINAYKQGFDENGNPTDLAKKIWEANKANAEYQENLYKNYKALQQEFTNFMIRQTTHDTYLNCIATGDWSGLNDLFKKYPQLQKIWGVTSIRNINFNSQADINLLKQYGLSDEEIQKYQQNPKLAKQFMQQHFIAIDINGKPLLKDAQKVAAVAGITPGRFNVYSLAFNNILQAWSNLNEANAGKLGETAAKNKEAEARTNYYNAQTNLTNVQADLAKQNADLNNQKNNLDIAIKQAELQQKIYALQKAKTEAEKNKIKEEITSHYSDFMSWIKDFTGNNISKENLDILLKIAKIVQDKDLPTNIETKISGAITALKNGYDILKELKNLPVDINVGTKIKDFLYNFLPSKWGNMSEEDKQLALKRLGLSSKIGAWLSKWINAMSGLSYTDQEFKRHLDNAFGGKLFVNKDAMIAAFSSYLEGIKESTILDINGLIASYPFSALTFKMDLYDTLKKLKQKSLNNIFGIKKSDNSGAKQ